jgi:hypothetical protein
MDCKDIDDDRFKPGGEFYEKIEDLGNPQCPK